MVRSRSHDVVAVGRAPLAVTSIAEVDLGTVRLPRLIAAISAGGAPSNRRR